MGKHTRYGRYVIDWNKVRDFVVPDLTGFTVRTPTPKGWELDDFSAIADCSVCPLISASTVCQANNHIELEDGKVHSK